MVVTKTNEGTFIIYNDVAMKVVGRTASELILVFNGKSYYVEPTTDETKELFNQLTKECLLN
jgi:hypothetical protein